MHTWPARRLPLVTETPAGQAFDIALLILIVMSTAMTMLETVHSYWVRYAQYFSAAEIIFTRVPKARPESQRRLSSCMRSSSPTRASR